MHSKLALHSKRFSYGLEKPHYLKYAKLADFYVWGANIIALSAGTPFGKGGKRSMQHERHRKNEAF